MVSSDQHEKHFKAQLLRPLWNRPRDKHSVVVCFLRKKATFEEVKIVPHCFVKLTLSKSLSYSPFQSPHL